MFTPKAFKEADFKIMQAFIKEQPQATVIAQTSNGMEACHIPMYWQDDGSKFGYFSRCWALHYPLSINY